MSLKKALEPRYEIDTHPAGWVLPNRAKYVNWIDKTFKYGKSPKPKCTICEEGEVCPLHTNTVELFPHQKFVKDYIQYDSPYRGMLLYYALGSGKTLASIAAAELLMTRMDVMVMLPASLHKNYVNEIRKYACTYYSLNQHWVKRQLDADELKLLKLSPQLQKKGVWVPDRSKPSNFVKLTHKEQEEITNQTKDVIENRFHFVHTDGLRKKSIMEMAKDGNPFDNKCIIIDEVHNLIESKLKPRFILTT